MNGHHDPNFVNLTGSASHKICTEQVDNETLPDVSLPQQSHVNDDRPSEQVPESSSQAARIRRPGPASSPEVDSNPLVQPERLSETHYTILSHIPGSTKIRIMPTDKLEEKVVKLEETLKVSQETLTTTQSKLRRIEAALTSTERDNAVLRAHNIEFARENAFYREQRSTLSNMRQQIRDTNAVDTTTGQLRTMENVLAENKELVEQWRKERNTVAVISECCKEWVKLEAGWKAERPRLENHVQALMARVAQQLRERNGMMGRIGDLEGLHHQLEQTITNLEHELRMQQAQKVVSQYPEL